MDEKRLSVRLNLDRFDHQKAWQILSAQPRGRMNEYIVSAVIAVHDKKMLENTIREVLTELFGSYEPKTVMTKTDGLPAEAIDFLDSL